MTRSLSAVATFLTTIALVDVAARAVLGTVDVNPTHAKSNGPGAPNFAQDTDVSPDGRTLYVSRGYLGDVVAFDISSRRLAPALTLVATIPVGDAPGWAEVADGGRVCLVANTRSDDLSIVSVPRRTEILRLPVGNGPKHITVARISGGGDRVVPVGRPARCFELAMYVPDHFNVTDQADIDAFLQRYDFATLVSAADGGLTATHLPVVVRREPSGLIVEGHVARANPHWKVLDGTREALLIFQGPHAYVSPTWYANSPAVPTWNYTVVHAYGPAQAVEERAFLENVLEALVGRNESHRQHAWRMDGLPLDYRTRALAAVVGIRMPVLRLEAKFKLGQNRATADRVGTVRGLEQEQSADASALATFMRSYLKDGA